MKICHERKTRNHQQIIFRKVWIICIENVYKKIDFFVTLMKLRLNFLFADISQHFEITLMAFALKVFIYRHGVRDDFKSFVSQNQKSNNHNPNIKQQIFKI